MCDGGKWNEAAEKNMNEAQHKSLDDAFDEPRPGRIILNEPRPQKMVMPRNPPGLLAYHIYPLIEESPLFYIVEDSPTLPDCIPMKRYNAKRLALLKSEWTLVPRYEWRDVTKESRFLVTHEGRSVRDGHTSEDFAVTITKRVELKD